MKVKFKQAIELDQYYTQPKIAEECLTKLKNILSLSNSFNDSIILEPSAGTGSFIEASKKVFKEKDIMAYDLEPKHSEIIQGDFLQVDLKGYTNIITIGNPPFGNRATLAVDFFNKAAECSSVIAFIVPVQFQKWSVQSKLDTRYKLIYDETLQPNAFVFNGKEFSARCCFQIWTTVNIKGYADLRIKEKPKTKHNDFELYQYNNTPEARKYFDYTWDFCVPRQGYYDYSLRIKDKNDCRYNVQYIFFKVKNPKAKDILARINFEELAKKNTTIPGFGKADVIQEYERLEKQLQNSGGMVA